MFELFLERFIMSQLWVFALIFLSLNLALFLLIRQERMRQEAAAIRDRARIDRLMHDVVQNTLSALILTTECKLKTKKNRRQFAFIPKALGEVYAEIGKIDDRDTRRIDQLFVDRLVRLASFLLGATVLAAIVAFVLFLTDKPVFRALIDTAFLEYSLTTALIIVTTMLFSAFTFQRMYAYLVRTRALKRLARDNINSAAAELSLLALKIEERAAAGEPPPFFSELPDVLREILNELLKIASSPPNPKHTLKITCRHLVNSLEKVCDWRRLVHGFEIKTDIKCDGEVRFDERAVKIVISCLHEMLGNIAKHAGAKKIRVSLHRLQDGLFRIIIKDDGVGFSLPETFDDLAASGHHGLARIAERAAELGGELTVNSIPDNGTILEMTWNPRYR